MPYSKIYLFNFMISSQRDRKILPNNVELCLKPVSEQGKKEKKAEDKNAPHAPIHEKIVIASESSIPNQKKGQTTP